ncbi:hypothetical protein DFH94DRAFT_754877 [Russula ochroleuca]|uniref:MPN domain-containing protein n=1 Tax=Russula ochroleuca TaxID=152965 RepID=A0A9P5T6Z1_9AGAM|nr:hypothetical protein DFH94DRAFT_754877 [Russula ochroleuca]
MTRYHRYEEYEQEQAYLLDLSPRSNTLAHNLAVPVSESSTASPSSGPITTRPPLGKFNRIPVNTITSTTSPPSSQGYSPPRSLSPYREWDPKLLTVSLPRDCLNRFTSIASINTARNRETCGLLLGKYKGGHYVVTTLLIPKQHSTSDTCAMDEEELVMQFTEGRSLITLGWIHTHPRQPCFMSSVDLHTHSGFQRMLPESFAVVLITDCTLDRRTVSESSA